MNVTLDLPKEILVKVRDDLSVLIHEQEDLLKMLKDNRAAIEAALSTVRRTTVTSESNLSRQYTVTKTFVDGFALGAATYECSCPSFQYERGLDDRSRCKHIRKVQGEGF